MVLHLLVQEEEDIAADEEEKVLIMAALLCLRAKINAPPRWGCSIPWKKKKDRQRMHGAIMLESDYFADNAIHTPLEFRRRFRMNKELIMEIVVGVREYDDYLR
jgi:hypothetical protein